MSAVGHGVSEKGGAAKLFSHLFTFLPLAFAWILEENFRQIFQKS